MEPSTSLEAEASKFTASGGGPGVADAGASIDPGEADAGADRHPELGLTRSVADFP